MWLTRILAAGVTSFLLGGLGQADTAPPPTLTTSKESDPCDATPCRAARTIILSAGEGTSLRFDVGRSPYLTEDGHIVIRPGETLFFRFDSNADSPGSPQFVRAEEATSLPSPNLSDPNVAKLDMSDLSTYAAAEEGEDFKTRGDPKTQIKNESADTFIVTLRQITGRTGLVLDITHNLTKALKLDAFIMEQVSGRWKLQYTSTCPILTNVRDTESWPEPLGGIILEHFRYATSDENTDTGNGTTVKCR